MAAGDSYVATGILLKAGMSLAEVLEVQTSCKQAIQGGLKRVSEWASGDQSSKRYYELTTLQLLEEVQYALERLAPDRYGQNIIPDRTRPRFC